MRNNCLDPTNKLPEERLEIMIDLFTRYPSKPNEKDLEKINQQKKVIKTKALLKEMFPFEEE